MNTAIWEKLYQFNHKPFQKKEGSRASAYEEEKPFLHSLPAEPYELSQWKIATVAPNYHISVDKMNYSVPYEYIKQKVDVRITRNMVEVFFGGNRICSHVRLHDRPNQYSTNEDHMPPEFFLDDTPDYDKALELYKSLYKNFKEIIYQLI